MPSETARGAIFHEGLAASWNRSYRRGGFKKRLALVRRLLSQVVHPGERWLDAGCGAGMLTLEMSRLGAVGLAVDGSQQMIDAAVREVGALSNRFAFAHVASVGSIEVSDATFDGVLCSSVIEYVGAVDQTLFEFNRVLKPGGILLLSAPNRNSLIRASQKGFRKLGARLRLELCPYLSVSVHDFTGLELMQQLRRAGFRARTLEGFDPILPAAFGVIVPPALYFVIAEKTSGSAAWPSGA